MRRPSATLLATLAIVVACAVHAPRLRVLLSLESLAEPALPSTAGNRRMREAFGVGHELELILAPAREGAALTPKQVAAFRHWLVRERAQQPDIASLTSPFDALHTRSDGTLPFPSPRVTRGTPAEMRGLADSPWGGVLTDAEGRDLAAHVEFRDTPAGSRYGRFDPAPVGRLLQRWRRDVLAGDSLRGFLAGPAAFEHFALEGVRRFRVLNVGMLLLIVVLLRVLVGTWRSGVLMSGALLVAGVCVAGGMALCGHPIDLLSTGLFLILAVAALEDFLFLSHLQMVGRGSWRRDFRVMLVPSFLTSLTTVIGFWSLCVSDLEIIRRLGLWAGIGAVVEWTVLFIVLPAVVARFPSWRRWTNPDRAWHGGAARRLAAGAMPRGIAWALLVVYAAGAYGALHQNRNDSIPRLFDAGHPYRSGFDYLLRTRGYQGSVSVQLPDFARRDEHESTLARIARLDGVARVLSPYDVLDDIHGRRVPPTTLAARAGELAERLPGFFARDRSLRAIVYVRRVDLVPLESTLAGVRAVVAEHQGEVGGELVTYAEFAARVPETLYRSLGTCLLLVGLLLWALLTAAGRRNRVAVLMASFWGPAVMLAVLWWLRVPLGFLTCIFASVLVGLTGDNVIQYLFAAGRGPLTNGIVRRGGASVLVSLFMAVACLVFLGSAFVPSRQLGVLLSVGFIASLFGDLWLLRGLLADRPQRG